MPVSKKGHTSHSSASTDYTTNTLDYNLDNQEIMQVRDDVQALINEAQKAKLLVEEAAASASATAAFPTTPITTVDDSNLKPPCSPTKKEATPASTMQMTEIDGEDEVYLPCTDICKTVVLDKRKGRGVVACVALKPGTVILNVKPSIAVLYNEYADTVCSQCSAAPSLTGRVHHTDKPNSIVSFCRACKCEALCANCADKKNKAGSGSSSSSSETSSVSSVHNHVCTWIRAAGINPHKDTDYIRFFLELAARVQEGEMSLLHDINALCTCEEQQSKEFLSFAETFSEKIYNQFRPMGMLLGQQTLYEAILRVKVNAVGFPIIQKHVTESDKKTTKKGHHQKSPAEEIIAGWAVHPFVAMFNHHCNPNCEVQCDEEGDIVIKTTRHVPAGEELCIHYVNLELDVETRSRELLEKYRFLCSCEKCKSDRDHLKRQREVNAAAEAAKARMLKTGILPKRR